MPGAMPRKRSYEECISPEPNTGCWLWTGSHDRNGYGQFNKTTAHRWVFEKLRGPLPPGDELDHLCRVRSCVNPDHLEPVSRRENVLRGTSNAVMHAAKTHCVNGHPFDETNTYMRPRRSGATSRSCRACTTAAQARQRERRRAHL
jgi:hypothetical protein